VKPETGDQYHADDDTGLIPVDELLIGIDQVLFTRGLLSIDANRVQR
jgi:hypothetical protein